jgi:hypothetical protein
MIQHRHSQIEARPGVCKRDGSHEARPPQPTGDKVNGKLQERYVRSDAERLICERAKETILKRIADIKDGL